VSWQLLVASSSQSLHPTTVAAREGFETALRIPAGATQAAAAALDPVGKVLARSAIVNF
jgi:hypothetical protein